MQHWQNNCYSIRTLPASFDERIQEAFNESLEIFEKEFDYHASFDKISQALEVAEPGVTNRFVTSYEKTRETIRF